MLTPTFLDGFTATIDYFRIKLDGAVGTIPESDILTKCAPTCSAAFCSQIVRGPGGILFGTGPVATTGHVVATNVNTGMFETKGLDFEANYRTSFDDWGMSDYGGLTVNFIGLTIKY